MKTYTLTELVDTANDQAQVEDMGRPWNARLVRHYTSKKVLAVPSKSGKNAVYTDAHLISLLELRRAQQLGFSASAFGNASKHYAATTSLQAAPTASGSALSLETPGYKKNDETDRSLSGFSGGINANNVNALVLPSIFSASGMVSPGDNIFKQMSAAAPSSAQKDNSTAALSFLRGLGKGNEVQAMASQLSAMTKSPVQELPIFHKAESWTSWDVLPGVRLQVRSDVLNSFSANEERAVIEVLRTINKP